MQKQGAVRYVLKTIRRNGKGTTIIVKEWRTYITPS
jgi:hypothetical protein